MRAAIYFTPPAGAPLTEAAARWLGRDAFSGEPTREADPLIDPLVAEPARYGFHATLRAPFRLAEGRSVAALDEALADFAAARETFVVPSLALARLGPFFALVPADTGHELRALESAVLKAFEPFRAPLTEAEIARRRPERLTARQRRYLAERGYPFVLEEFRFHLTLTGPLGPDEAGAVEPSLRERLADFDGAPLLIDALALFVEPEPGAPFRVQARHPFRSPSLSRQASRP